MFYVQTRCPTCRVGLVGMCRLDDGSHLALMCSRCDTLYDEPARLTAAHGAYPPHAALAAGAAPRWASQSEIALRGWLHEVAGERVRLD